MKRTRTLQMSSGPLHAANRARGSALIVALIILLLMTLIGTAGIQGTVMQERMAGNVRDRNLAFEAAEAALRAGEILALDTNTGPYSGADGLYDWETAQNPGWDVAATWTGTSSIIYSDAALSNLSAQPRFFLEQLAPMSSGSLEVGVELQPRMVGVTARGIGGSPDAAVVLRTVIRP